jgi:hypothetical protein
VNLKEIGYLKLSISNEDLLQLLLYHRSIPAPGCAASSVLELGDNHDTVVLCTFEIGCLHSLVHILRAAVFVAGGLLNGR